MLSNNALVGALIFVLMIVGVNFLMFIIARGRAKGGGDARWIDALKQGLTKPLESERNKSMEELRQQMKKLEKKEEEKE
jgi:hypothetical protein